MMKQYFAFKAQNPEAILLMRVGDFYESYGEDAETASRILGILLTKRSNGADKDTSLAGFPHHSLDTYLPKLVRAGYKVAVCDQLEDPKMTKKLVKRGVTELVTPGVVYNEQLLNAGDNNYLAALAFFKDRAGVAFLDVSTGELKVSEGPLDFIEVLLGDYSPKEVLVQKGYEKGFRDRFLTGKAANTYVSTMDEWAFVYESALIKLREHFGTDSLKGFGVETLTLALTAAGATIFYLENNGQTRSEFAPQRTLSHICSIRRIDAGDFVWLDKFTIRNLELLSPLEETGLSLRAVLDHCATPMGSRQLREWIAMPAKNIKEINARQEVVADLASKPDFCSQLYERLGKIGDLERIISRAAAGRILPREVLQLQRGLGELTPLKQMLYDSAASDQTRHLAGSIHPCSELVRYIKTHICPNPAQSVGKGNVIADGVSTELDELRAIEQHGKEILDGICARESERTGISSLKISFNNVFGYYLEVRNIYKDKVPEEWIRKQTLVSAERYITPELKEYEEKITGAQERIVEIEARLYAEVVAAVQQQVQQILANARVIARLDCLCSFAWVANEWHYCRPLVDDSLELEIKQGRHPVIERTMETGEAYIANDLLLDSTRQQIIILTGPNMSGKSALLRQSALIVLMAQIGSFVPAAEAHIGICDKIFTRVGASDNISRGESTFMVEMLETATILHNMTKRSLILLDEIGRGTSTFDGMSIAWAIVEYIHAHGDGAKTLFATHYHELNELENSLKRCHNYHIAVKEKDGKVLFLRKLCPGGVAHSFGIHVARMAGMPVDVVRNAEKILKKLEEGSDQKEVHSVRQLRKATTETQPAHSSLFSLDDPLLESIRDTLRDLDLNSITPLDAFATLRDLKKRLGVTK